MGDGMIRDKVIKKFGNKALHNSCLWYDKSEETIFEFLQMLKGKIEFNMILEIGTFYGLSAVVFAEHFKEVYTIDIIDQTLREELWSFLKTNNITYILAKNDEVKKEQVQKIIKKGVQLAFIDGWHWNGQPEYDYNICKEIPWIIFHDYNDVHTEVVSFVDSLPGKKLIKNGFVLYENKS
jgi:hypothetical protein